MPACFKLIKYVGGDQESECTSIDHMAQLKLSTCDHVTDKKRKKEEHRRIMQMVAQRRAGAIDER